MKGSRFEKSKGIVSASEVVGLKIELVDEPVSENQELGVLGGKSDFLDLGTGVGTGIGIGVDNLGRHVVGCWVLVCFNSC